MSKRTIEPLLQPNKFDLWWIDGSDTLAGEQLPVQYKAHHTMTVHVNIRGGADAAIVYSLTTLLEAGYDYIGIVENDVLLEPDWFEPTMSLFEPRVGAVSARSYEDRVLFQCDGYAVMHNLGAGMVIFSREAAHHILNTYRTGHTIDNRAVFGSLAGVDIAARWCFRDAIQTLTADWSFDAQLARVGLQSRALTPAKTRSLDPNHAGFGLREVREPLDVFRDPDGLRAYEKALAHRRRHRHELVEPAGGAVLRLHGAQAGQHIVFAHHMRQMVKPGGAFLEATGADSDWRLRWSQGFGPFGWQAARSGAKVKFPLFGQAALVVMTKRKGCHIRVFTDSSDISPEIPDTGEIVGLSIPGRMETREVQVSCDEGAVILGLQCGQIQPWFRSSAFFRHYHLPPVA
ncbi:MAG: hypothetical protein C5B50_00720 [Verrucomicrobia bacterium]|nr:MAG: hypothetical protein C5B50_00720 [Verrucomicrobiota bacterium]